MKYYLIIFFLTFTLPYEVRSQNINCNEIRLQRIPELSKNDKSVISDIYGIVSYCLEFDSTDSLIFNEISLSTLIVGISNQNTPVTYGSIIDMIQNIRKSDFYDKTKANVEFYNTYLDKTISQKESSAIYKGFRSLNESINTDSLIAFIYSRDNNDLTYKQAYLKYLNILNNIEEQQINEENNEFNSIFQEFDYYGKALVESEKSNKNLILYFTGYADINGRKFESTTLRNREVLDIIKRSYNFYPLFVDDKTKIEDKLQEKIKPLAFSNKGKYYHYLQETLINNKYQTTLAIINTKGKVVFQKQVSQLTPKELLKILKIYSK